MVFDTCQLNITINTNRNKCKPSKTVKNITVSNFHFLKHPFYLPHFFPFSPLGLWQRRTTDGYQSRVTRETAKPAPIAMETAISVLGMHYLLHQQPERVKKRKKNVLKHLILKGNLVFVCICPCGRSSLHVRLPLKFCFKLIFQLFLTAAFWFVS